MTLPTKAGPQMEKAVHTGGVNRWVLLEISEDAVYEDLGVRHKIPRIWRLVVSCGPEKAMGRSQLLTSICI